MAKSAKSETTVYKEDEFETFISLLEQGDIENWGVVADALGVNRDTITAWKRLPKARKAIAEGINRSLKQMETTGKRDWRMWREKAKVLGVIETERNLLATDPNSPLEVTFKRSDDNNKLGTST